MTLDQYTKAVLTMIAIALTVIALNPWIGSYQLHAIKSSVSVGTPIGPQIAEAGAPEQEYKLCVSQRPVPKKWGKVVAAMTDSSKSALVFETDDAIKLIFGASPYV